MNVPEDATRRRVLTGSGAAIATALAGCGSPGEGGEENASGDGAGGTETDSVAEAGNDSAGDPSTDNDSDDPYAPEENSTEGSGESTVSQRTPDDDGDGADAGGADEENQSGS